MFGDVTPTPGGERRPWYLDGIAGAAGADASRVAAAAAVRLRAEAFGGGRVQGGPDPQVEAPAQWPLRELRVLVFPSTSTSTSTEADHDDDDDDDEHGEQQHQEEEEYA